MSGVTAFDKADDIVTTGFSPFTSGSITPTHDGDLLIAVGEIDNASTFSLTAPFTLLAGASNITGTNYGSNIAMSYYTQTTAAPITATLTGAAPTYGGIHIVSFH